MLSDPNKLLILYQCKDDQTIRPLKIVKAVDYFLNKQIESVFNNNNYVIMEKDNRQNHIIISYDEEYINLKMNMENELR